MVIKLIIPIIPTGQMRARHANRGKFSTTYKHEKQEHRENVLMSFLAQHQPREPMQGPLYFGFKAYLPIPKSKSKKWKAAAAEGKIRPTTKPDLDNLAKMIKDCLTTMRYWEDDKQVVEYLAGTGKYYSENPHWEIEIWEDVPF